tara:strand:- start:165 stop:431 length:267 start_codon:yes stop_codon:yes gene_type:complete
MHRTTTTVISDSIARLNEIDTRLNDADWMPVEERIDFAVRANMFFQGFLDGVGHDECTDEETTYIENLIVRLNEFVVEIQTTDSDSEC